MRVPLELDPGLVSDDTTFSTPGRYGDASNVRFWRGKPQTIGGWSTVTTDMVSGKCRAVISWADNDAAINIALGTHTHLYVFNGGMLYDITPAGLTVGNEDSVGGPGYGADTYNTGTYGTIRSNYYARTWSFSTYGESLIANPRLQGIYQWENSTGSDAVLVANAPVTVAYALITPERQLMALGCNEVVSGGFNPLCIRFSDTEDITDWTPTDDNLSEEIILEGGGRIVAGRLFGNGVAVWTDNAVYFGTFTGDTTQPWRFDRIEGECGLAGPNAVAVINQTAIWIAPDGQFRIWGLGVPPQILPCPIREDFAQNVAESQADKIVATTVSRYGEVWFHYPDSRDGAGIENSRYLIYNTLEQVWSRGHIARTAATDAGVAGFPIMVSPAGEIFFHEFGNNANGGNLDWFIQTADFYIDDGGRHFMVRSISPDFEDQEGAVNLTLCARRYPQGAIRTHGPKLLAGGGSKKDLRISGAVFAIRFSGASNPSYMRMGRPVFDVVTTGER